MSDLYTLTLKAYEDRLESMERLTVQLKNIPPVELGSLDVAIKNITDALTWMRSAYLAIDTAFQSLALLNEVLLDIDFPLQNHVIEVAVTPQIEDLIEEITHELTTNRYNDLYTFGQNLKSSLIRFQVGPDSDDVLAIPPMDLSSVKNLDRLLSVSEIGAPEVEQIIAQVTLDMTNAHSTLSAKVGRLERALSRRQKEIDIIRAQYDQDIIEQLKSQEHAFSVHASIAQSYAQVLNSLEDDSEVIEQAEIPELYDPSFDDLSQGTEVFYQEENSKEHDYEDSSDNSSEGNDVETQEHLGDDSSE